MAPSTVSPRIAVIGTGIMGEPMAHHLLNAYSQLTVLSRTPRPALLNAGATEATSACEIGQSHDAALVMLPDLPQLRDLLDGETGLIAGLEARPVGKAPLLLMIGSTSSATGIRALDAELRERLPGTVSIVDTPVSGGEDGALSGTLKIMVGGTEADARRAIDLLAPTGEGVHLGPLGAGQVAKACNQLVVGATMFALGEATVLAERSGLDVAAMWDLLAGGYSGSRLLDTRKDKLVSGDDAPSGPIKYLLKDIGIGLDIADATGTNAAMLPVLERLLREVVEERGLGDRDLATTRRFVEERS